MYSSGPFSEIRPGFDLQAELQAEKYHRFSLKDIRIRGHKNERQWFPPVGDKRLGNHSQHDHDG